MDSRDLRSHYSNLLAHYPDVVNLPTFIEMIGIAESFARRLLRSKRVKSLMAPARKHIAYYIPKECVLDYITSEAFQNHSHRQPKWI